LLPSGHTMIRWIAFDDETAEAVVSRFKRGAAEIRQGDPLDAALGLGKASVVVLPSSVPGKVLVARFQPKTEDAPNAPLEAEPIAYEPTGFLGLIDEPVFKQIAEPVSQGKKKWWHKRSA
jgi:hypothetical protein